MFSYIVSLSLKACVIVPIAVLVRTLLRRYPKRYSYALWIIVFASFVVKINLPIAVSTPVRQVQHTIQQQYDNVLDSYVGDISIHHENTSEYTQAVQQGITPIVSQNANYVVTEKNTFNPPQTVQNTIMPTLQLAWGAGMLVLLIVYLRSLINIFSTIKFAVHYKYDIYYSENIISPFVFGIVKPKIYLPYSVTSEQAEFVIAHERTHIKRLDYLVKPLCLFISIFHFSSRFIVSPKID